jgi:hypothetical protein
MCRYSRVHYRLINILLVIAGILLALALFGAGAGVEGQDAAQSSIRVGSRSRPPHS